MLPERGKEAIEPFARQPACPGQRGPWRARPTGPCRDPRRSPPAAPTRGLPTIWQSRLGVRCSSVEPSPALSPGDDVPVQPPARSPMRPAPPDSRTRAREPMTAPRRRVPMRRPPLLVAGLALLALVLGACSGTGQGVAAGLTVGHARPSGPLTADEAAALVLASDPRFSGIGPLDPDLIGQDRWYEVGPGTTGFMVTVTIGWGDCPSGCINRHIWRYEVAPDRTVRLGRGDRRAAARLVPAAGRGRAGDRRLCAGRAGLPGRLRPA